MDRMPALQLFGAGREKRLYAVPPYTDVKSLDFADRPFRIDRPGHTCALCGSTDSFLDEVPLADGATLWTCSDTDHCREQQEGRPHD
jgi:alpha-D-ribose 1-methylphosphonate 5-phosphate C-P lyase